MEIKKHIEKALQKINENHAYKLKVFQQKDGRLSLQAFYRRKNINSRQSIWLVLENKTSFYAIEKDKATLKEAERKLVKLDEKMKEKLTGIYEELNFLEFFELCIDKPTSDGKLRKKGTKKNWKSTLNHLRRFIKENYYTTDINFDNVNYRLFAMLHSWAVNNLKPYTANGFWSVIKRFIKYAIVEDRIKEPNLYLKIQTELRIKKPEINRTEDDYLTLQELITLRNYPYPVRYKIPFIFNCYLGLRIGDLKILRWDNFSTDFGIIDIIEEKGTKQHRRPVHPFITKTLNELYPKRNKKSKLIFDLPKCDSKTNNHFKRWGMNAGIFKKMTSHIMRRTFINQLENSGVSIMNTSQIIDHSSTKITEQYYLAKNQRILQQELKKLPSLDDVILRGTK